MPFALTSRGRFFYRQAPGDTPCLLFLHGNLGTSRWWKPVLDRLPVGWRGLALDAIGSGHSDRTDRLDRFAVGAQVLDVIAVVNVLGVEKFHLIAHSTATPAAVELALAYPDRVASLILVGPVPASGVTTPPEAFPLLERLLQDRALLAQAIHASIPTLDPSAPEFAQWVEDAGSASPSALVAIARGLDAWQPGARLRQLTLPTLLVRGAEDMMLSEEEAHQTLLAIPGANNLEVFQGLGHSPMVENPQGFAEVMLGFIADLLEPT